jgi:hypothetical protein
MIMSLKANVLEAIAGKNRGLLVNEVDKVKILTTVEKLEDHNPHPQPLETPLLLDGDWRLLYTTSKSILGLNNFPLLQLGQIYQCIRTENSRLYNIAEITGVPFLEGLVSVVASFEPVSAKRVNVKFERSIIGLQRLLGYLSPQDLINKIEMGNKFPPFDFSIKDRNQQGWLEITYLDEDLRIGRGNQGNLFILSKENVSLD